MHDIYILKFVLILSFSEKYEFLVTSDNTANNGNISVWDGHTGVNLMTLAGQKLANNSIAIIGDTVIGCVENKSQLELWKLSNEGKKKVIPISAPARSMVYYENLNILACFLGYDIYMWQPETGHLLSILGKIHSHPGTQILFTTAHNVITMDESGLIVYWTMNMNEFSDMLWKCRPFGITKIHCVLIEERQQLFVVAESGKSILISLIDGRAISELIDLSLTAHCVARYRDKVYIGCNKGTLVTFSVSQRAVIKKLVVRDSSLSDHTVTQLTLSPDKKLLVLAVDGCTALTISSIEEDFSTKRPFTFGQSVTSLCTVRKTGSMFLTGTDEPSKIAIGRLSFSLSQSTRIVEVRVGKCKLLQDIMDAVIRDPCCTDQHRKMKLSKARKIRNGKQKTVQKNIFIALNKA